MGQVLHGSATTTEAIRRAIQHSQESLRALAKRYGDQPEDGRQVEEADFGRRSADRAERAEVDGAVDRGGGDHRRLPAAHAAAARRLPLCAAADDPAPDAVFTASLPAAPRHRDACRMSKATSRRRRSSRPTRSATSTSTLPRCRPPKASSISSSPSTGPASSPSCNCVRKAGRTIGVSLPRRPDRSRSLQDPHRSHRQRHPVHRSHRATPMVRRRAS